MMIMCIVARALVARRLGIGSIHESHTLRISSGSAHTLFQNFELRTPLRYLVQAPGTMRVNAQHNGGTFAGD